MKGNYFNVLLYIFEVYRVLLVTEMDCLVHIVTYLDFVYHYNKGH